MTDRLRRIAWANLVIALAIAASIFGLAIVTVTLVDAVLSVPAHVLEHLDLSGLDGPLFAVDLQQAADARGTSARDPKLIDEALEESGTAAFARLPDGTAALHASRRKLVKNRWRVGFTRPGGPECVTVPAALHALAKIHNGRCAPNLAR